MGFGDFFRTFEVSGARVSLASFGERVDFAEQGDDSTEVPVRGGLHSQGTYRRVGNHHGLRHVCNP